MSLKKLRPTFTFDQDRLDALKAIAPEAFADGKINWDTLREALGERLEEEGAEAEHFGLTWPGKRAARRLASQPSAGTLRPVPGEGVNEDTTRHLFIEGDNLEVLKLLQKSYAGRVKMIYIDPPYNTGNDFIYRDDYRQPLEEYLLATGQMDEVGRVLTTNPKAGGRFHSNWLNMMYPRLSLARSLLREDGLIFVSVDDIEVHNVRMLMNEVFGGENFIAQITWKNVYGGGAKSKHVVPQHEYVLCFARQGEAVGEIELPPDPEARKRYTERDDKYPKRGPYFTQPLATTSMDFRPNLRFPIMWQGEEVWPEKQWQWSRERVEQALTNNELVIRRENDKWSVRYKQYLRDEDGQERGSKLYSVLTGPWSQEGTAEIEQFFGDGKVFSFPKPSKLIKRLLSCTWRDENALIVDFFAGSCPTAQAVLELNRDYGGNRRYIMVQLPEPTPADSAARRAGYANIAEIGKERIRRVIQRMQAGDQPKLIPDRETPEDLGLRVFKLERSHFKAWQDYEGDDVAQLETLFDRFESPLVEGWRPGDLLVEVMLMQGFPLDSAVTPLGGCPHNHVLRVTSDLAAHELFVCLDERLHPATLEALAPGAEDVFVCLDSALDEETKLRLQDGRNVMVI